MPECAFFCVIPAERASLADAITSAGGIPVPTSPAAPQRPFPTARLGQVNNCRSVPGTGPVILSGSHKGSGAKP